MKLVGLKSIAAVALLVSLAGVASGREGPAAAQGAQQTLAVAPDATVSLCVERGDVLVRGTNGREVRASAAGAARIELRRAANTPAAGPARSLEVVASDDRGVTGCSFSGSVAVDVPRGATVVVKTVLARVTVSDVSVARVETVSGEVSLQGIARSAEASSANGDLSLRKSAGRVRLQSISASIEAAEVKPVEAADQFFAKTTSGDITLAQLGHARVEATTTSGYVDLTGTPARGGVYVLKAYSGGIKVTMPADASFRVDARVAHGEIVTDFPVKQAQDAQAGGVLHGQHSTVRVSGVAGSDPQATLTLSSFSGILQLRKAAAR